jgi:hypothetical protein
VIDAINFNTYSIYSLVGDKFIEAPLKDLLLARPLTPPHTDKLILSNTCVLLLLRAVIIVNILLGGFQLIRIDVVVCFI